MKLLSDFATMMSIVMVVSFSSYIFTLDIDKNIQIGTMLLVR